MKRLWAVLATVALILPSFVPRVVQAAFPDPTTPKTLNLYLGYLITDQAVVELAKWDMIVLDMDQQFQFPQQVRRIRQLNPNIKILAYVSAGEIADARFKGDPRSPGRRLADRVSDSWFLKRPDGSRASWWPGAWAMNATDLGPAVNGLRWNTFLGPFIRDELMSSGLWDGVFLDAAYEQVTGFFGPNLDPDLNGVANPAKQNDEEYRKGMDKLIRNVRAALGNDKLILNNSSTAYASVSNGALFENFPRYGWAGPFQSIRQTAARNPQPAITSINTNTNNVDNPRDYRLMRFGLATALLADVFYSFDAGDAGHHRTWWYDEYDASIGRPRADARLVKGSSAAKPGVWMREYAKGVALVNATGKAETVTLPGEFERLKGTQDKGVNNGAIVTSVTVPPQDGLVLTRRGDVIDVRGSAFTSGDFLQVFDATGNRLRNGFFASRSGVPGGAAVLVEDLDRDGRDDVAFAKDGLVTLRFGSGATRSFRPYGSAYRGGISLAAGQTDRTASWELVLAPTGPNVASTVLVVDTRLYILRKWLAYAPNFRGGSTVAVGDLNRDNLREIITVPGKTGGPHVRSFKTDGALWRGAFFAFDEVETAGASVAVGDVDGDGRDEIVVGSGPGTRPRIRVYDEHNRLESEFEPTGVPLSFGVRPTVADLDGDGKDEILIPGNPF